MIRDINFFSNKNFAKRYFSKKIEIFSVPFKITKKEALKILSENHSSFEKEINSSNKYIEKNLHKVYIPFHTAIIKNLCSQFYGKKGFDRIEYYTALEPNSDGKGYHYVTRHRIVTDWYNVVGVTDVQNYNTKLENYHMHIYGGFDYPKEYIKQSITMTSIPKEDFLKVRVLEDSEVLPHNMNYSKAFDDILSELINIEKNNARKKIKNMYNCDRTSIDNLHMSLENIKLESFSYHIPAYVYISEVHDKKICKIVNGYDGRYSGDAVYSELKFGLGGSTIGTILGITSIFLTPHTLIPRLILFRIGASALAGGIIGSLSSYFYTEFKYSSARSSIEKEKYLNSKSVETFEDIKRKKLEYNMIDNSDDEYEANNINKNNKANYKNKTNNSSNKKTFVNFKEYQLLEIDINKPITRQILSDARNKMLLKWHPDIHKGDKELATLMTTQINESYTTLLRTLK